MGISVIYRRCSKRAVFIFLSTALVFITIRTISNKRSSSLSTHHHISRRPGSSERLTRQQAHKHGVDDPRDPRFYNIITEDDALMFQPCKDIYKTASTQHSTISFSDNSKDKYTVGETIRVVVTLYDHYGQRKYSGGDQLRATMENKTFLASAPCIVNDNRDGTHAVLCEAFWGGDSIINVKLAYTREIITSIYRTRTKVLANRKLCGLYMNRTSTDETPCTPCHPNNTYLRLLSNYTQLCNLTSFNTGMPFYCGKPTNELLSCKDLQRVKMEKCEVLPITDSEKALFKRGQVTFNQTLKVTVENRREDKYFSVIDRPSIPCSQYNISQTWHFRRPTGFLYGGKWNLQTCLGVQKQHYMSCLKNRRLYLFGDSTVRQWYEAVIKRFKCKLTSDGFEKCPKCQGESMCVNRDINFKAKWYFHAHPIFMGRAWGTKRHWHSISFRIDNLPRNERAIVLIHVYAHVINFHHNVFRQKMEIIRKSVENYLLDSKYSIVLIKAPHAFEGPAGECRLHDYYGDVYSKILFEVFDGLHDKVILLNNRDATLAQHEKLVHPKGNIVNAMIDQMMNFVCY